MTTKHYRLNKVLLVGDCLSSGGAEKVHALLSIYFQKQGLEVHNCIFMDWLTYEYSGTLMNLGTIKPNSFLLVRKFARFNAFKKFVKENSFDVIIDFRMRTNFGQEFLISKIVYNTKTIYSVRSGILEFYFPKNAFLSKLIYKNRTINCVSKAIKEKIIQHKLATDVNYIYNPIFFDSIENLKNEYEVDKKYMLAIGRMNDEVKQFDELILAYSKSILPKENIKLIFIGDGKFKEKYIKISEKLQLQHLIEFLGHKNNPFPYYKNALFTVLSSKNEGFPNVIIESLACETPVVSYDCFSGPSEIIINNENGILVENQNQQKMIEAMNQIISNKELYLHCKNNAKASVEKFSIENIGNQWLQLFNSLHK